MKVCPNFMSDLDNLVSNAKPCYEGWYDCVDETQTSINDLKDSNLLSEDDRCKKETVSLRDKNGNLIYKKYV